MFLRHTSKCVTKVISNPQADNGDFPLYPDFMKNISVAKYGIEGKMKRRHCFSLLQGLWYGQ